ncbi:MAG: hypothetical protein JWP91_3073 [Fibrobacteres bacterium]|nr:hypothetical protein [Fibrobacterota bacterium]
MLAFSRIPGNAFSFWIRQTLRWSRGRPSLPHEPKEDLFAYLSEGPEGGGNEGGGNKDVTAPGAAGAEAAAVSREAYLRARYRLDDLANASTRALYRKNLYLIDILEKAAEGLPVPAIAEAGSGADGSDGADRLAAMDVGSQDWHYVFGLERWLRHGGDAPARSQRVERTGPPGPTDPGRQVALRGVEVDGYGIYPDFRSRKDYALAYAEQTGNSQVTYEVGDFLKAEGRGLDVMTLFYPFVTRHHLLLWGLPLRFFRPERLLAKAAALIRPGGWLLVFTHTLKEHEAFLELGRAEPGFALAKEGRALSDLVHFHEDVADRHYSVWRRV